MEKPTEQKHHEKDKPLNPFIDCFSQSFSIGDDAE
tara:strand:+ start:213 stop:317 length:105 start_codon:yes stop_codon:yes gene_type:complete